jgi:hypothetical protein
MQPLPSLRFSRSLATPQGHSDAARRVSAAPLVLGGLVLFGAGLSIGLVSRSAPSTQQGIVLPVKYADRKGMMAVRISAFPIDAN